MRRHDFDACFVEDILDILMQIRVNLVKAVGIPDIGHLINRIIILKGSLQYKRALMRSPGLKEAHQSDQILHRIAYHKDCEQIGSIVGYSTQNNLYRIPDVGE